MSLGCQPFCLGVAVLGPLISFLVYLLPVPFEPVSFHLPAPPYLGDELAANNRLQGAERILEGLVTGPESLAVQDGVIYSGTADGKIIRINQDLKVTELARLGSSNCSNELECGRPLGIRFGPDGFLYTTDAVLGLFKINISTGDKLQLVSRDTLVEGKPLLFFNDLDIQSDGIIYFTHSSTRWHRHQHLSMAMEGRSDSRLLRYDPVSRKISVLMDGLAVANGVQLSKDESFLLVAEGARMRIHRYFLKVPQRGSEIFAENLPGFVDNIRQCSGGGFWVALPTVRRHCIFDSLGPRPWLRKLLLKFFSPEVIFSFTTRPYGLILKLSVDGETLERLDDPTGEVVSHVSEVIDTGSHLYLGSYSTPFLSRIESVYWTLDEQKKKHS